jgi:hypothetical protein
MSGVPCSKCGRTSQAGPDLELDVPAPPPPKLKPASSKRGDEELKIEFAVDPEDLRPPAPTSVTGSVAGGSFPPSRASGAPGPSIALAPIAARTMAMANAPSNRPSAILTPLENDEELAARTLANYGAPPNGALFAPLYAYKVYKRRKELAEALRGRREESSLATLKLEDALVALGERARATAAGDENAKTTLDALARAEKLLRSRDQSLAREHDQHKERIASIDQRLAGVETELGQAQGGERAVSAELADAQTQLQRAEARLKQAETEIKAITSRDRGAKA